MTSWAVQPSSWGNELKANAEFGHSFDRIQDIALDWATDQMEAMTIWKVGTVAEFKWMEVNAWWTHQLMICSSMILSSVIISWILTLIPNMTKINTKVRYWTNQQENPRLVSFPTYESALAILEDFSRLGWRAEIAPPHVWPTLQGSAPVGCCLWGVR